MLLAVKRSRNLERGDALAEIEKIKDFYSIHEHCLETLLSASKDPSHRD